MRRHAFFGSIFLFASLVSAQPQPNVSEILQKVSEKYKAATEYEFAADIALPDPNDLTKKVSTHVRFVYRAPDRYRAEGVPGIGDSNDPNFSDARIIYDGTGVWLYLPKPNKYAFIPATDISSGKGDLGDIKPEAMDQFFMYRYRNAPTFARGATIARQESVDFSGAKRDCYVITMASGYIWWVDAENDLILREDSPESTAVFTTLILNSRHSDDLFRFAPPSGATKLDFK